MTSANVDEPVNGSALVDTGVMTVVDVDGSVEPRLPIGVNEFEVVLETFRSATLLGVDELDELLELEDELDELEDDACSSVVLVVEDEDGWVLEDDELEEELEDDDDDELDEEELEDDELDEELEDDELVVEVGWSVPTQNRTWLMVGG